MDVCGQGRDKGTEKVSNNSSSGSKSARKVTLGFEKATRRIAGHSVGVDAEKEDRSVRRSRETDLFYCAQRKRMRKYTRRQTDTLREWIQE